MGGGHNYELAEAVVGLIGNAWTLGCGGVSPLVGTFASTLRGEFPMCAGGVANAGVVVVGPDVTAVGAVIPRAAIHVDASGECASGATGD